MSTTELQTAAARESLPAAAPKTLKGLLASPGIQEQLAKCLPKHITPERMARVAMTALLRTPKLAECDQTSFFQALFKLSQWGLEPDGERAHLIPFENRSKGIVECQVIIDYKGYVELIYRSGVVKRLHADLVYEGDIFDYSLGEVSRHIPHFLRSDKQRPEHQGAVVGAYIIATMEAGISKTELMSAVEINHIRDLYSQGYARAERTGRKDSPWHKNWGEMAKKTVLRRIRKWLPLSAELRDAFDEDQDRTIDEQPAPQKYLGADEFEKLLAGPQAQAETEQSAEAEPTPESDPAPLAELTAALSAATTISQCRTLCTAWAGPESPLADAALCAEAERRCLAREAEIRAGRGERANQKDLLDKGSPAPA